MDAKERMERWFFLTTGRIIQATKNKLFLAAGFLFQGMSFLLHPDRAPSEIIQFFGITLFMIAAANLFAALFPRDMRVTFRTIVPILITAFTGILSIVLRQTLAPYLRYGIGVILLLTGGRGLAQLLHLHQLASLGDGLLFQITYTERLLQNEVNQNIEKAAQEQAHKNLLSALKLLSRLNKAAIGPWLTNSLTFLMGIAILAYPDQSGDVLFRISAIAILIAGFSELWTYMMLRRTKNCEHNKGDTFA